MTDAKVIQFPLPRDDDYDGFVCDCGEAWFKATVAFNRDGGQAPGSYASPIICVACEKEYP
jgi:hypothetical protein